MKTKYKAIIFDLDGTVVPSILEGMPSDAVVKAVQRVKGKIKLSSASARAVQYCRNIWQALSLEDPCIINGGSQIINPKTEKVIWEQLLPEGAIKEVLDKARGYTETVAFNGVIFNINAKHEEFPKNTNLMVAFGVKKEKTESLVNLLSMIPDVAVHVLHSWVEGDYWDFHIIHKLATKKHAVAKLIEILGVQKEEVIGVGDGNNDMPLFEAVGYKVAMGNAANALKENADYVTDTLDNDGFAKFIEEKIIKTREFSILSG